MGSRREEYLHLAVGVVDAVAGLHVIRIDVREPADAATRRRLEELALLVEKDEVVLSGICQHGNGGKVGRRWLTRSLTAFATAFGLLGWTLGEVTDGQPFYGVTVNMISKMVKQLLMRTSSKYIFFPSPCWMNQLRSFITKGHDAFATPAHEHPACPMDNA